MACCASWLSSSLRRIATTHHSWMCIWRPQAYPIVSRCPMRAGNGSATDPRHGTSVDRRKDLLPGIDISWFTFLSGCFSVARAATRRPTRFRTSTRTTWPVRQRSLARSFQSNGWSSVAVRRRPPMIVSPQLLPVQEPFCALLDVLLRR